MQVLKMILRLTQHQEIIAFVKIHLMSVRLCYDVTVLGVQ